MPVSSYSRHVVYDMGDLVMLVDRLFIQYETNVALRFRNNGLNKTTLPKVLSSTLVSMPSDRGNYRTLIKVITPVPPTTWNVTDEHGIFPSDSYLIQTDHIGAQVRSGFPRKVGAYQIVTMMHMGLKNASNTLLDNAGPIVSTSSFGGCGMTLCAIVSNVNGGLRSALTYTTPVGVLASAKHVIADMDNTYCYVVNSAGISLSGLKSVALDNSIVFIAGAGGANTFVVSIDPACTASPSKGPTQSPSARPTKRLALGHFSFHASEYVYLYCVEADIVSSLGQRIAQRLIPHCTRRCPHRVQV